MRNFKLNEVRLRGRGFTLFKACENQGVKKDVVDEVLWAMNIAVNSVSKEGYSNSEQMEIEEKNPILPNTIKKEDFRNTNLINDCIVEGVIKENNDGSYDITEKMIKVLEETAKIQEELDSSNFYFCPCEFY